ncbi:YHYH protein [uncultured Paraglaciecola sp.]|uniref:YHYH protein n=1 Tax=uncultured Paraglaciecola sp. TaxID=1765024 RepID=UPI0030DD186E|tara:strand:- start:287500 stop:288879 length:1380 start_codon:yes stop_codon:yes gene_type:complete
MLSKYQRLGALNLSYLLIPLALTLSACGDTDSVNTPTEITPTNTTPVANAGIDQNVTVNTTVTLDGSSSTDADGDTLTFTWVLTDLPTDSNASLQNQTDVEPSFTADLAGNYTLSLTVNDGTITSAADQVTIVASNNSIDITNVYFSSLQASCTEYTGSYSSNVTDVLRNVDFKGDVEISQSGGTCVISSNDIPNHDFNDQGTSFANDVSEQNNTYIIASSPQVEAQVTPISLNLANAVFLNGATVDLLAAACYDVGNEALGNEKIGCGQDQIDNPWRYDPMSSLNTFGTDSHNAHAQPDGTYHYHGNPLAMFEQDCDLQAAASPVIGFAADGFPIYGSCFTDPISNSVKKAESSFVLRNNGGVRVDVSGYTTPVAGQGVVASNNYDGQFIGDFEYVAGSGDLDECNGMTVNGQYGYYVTDSYPWILACYKGQVNDSFTKTGAALKNRMHGHGDLVHSH